MKYKKTAIAVITARSGSKRIKNKNIILFFGKPMIAHSIICAKKSNLFSEIFVCTDSKKIKKISEQYGAKVPFLRSKKLSDDITGTHEVVKSFLINIGKKYSSTCCIYPTAPLMRHADLVKGYKKLQKNKLNYVFSANLSKKSDKKIIIRNKIKYTDSGQFYWGEHKTWLHNSKLLNKNSLIVKIPKIYAQDLNTFEDLKVLKKNKTILQKKND